MSITDTAAALAKKLKELDLRIVFAESCTAGLVSATLARVAGISQWHCGSAVTYRDRTKQDWLSVSKRVVQQETAVCETVAKQMARGVLSITEEANIAASVTGHLGPDAPPELDGVVYVSIARRQKSKQQAVGTWRFRLRATTRYRRQREATEIVLQCLIRHIH